MFRSMGFQLMSSLMCINLLQKFTNKEIQILHQVSQVQQGHTQSRWIRKPFSFWWAHGNWGSNLNLKKMLRRFYGWYLFLLQKNTLFSIHIFPYDFFLCVFCRFSFKLGCISSSVKARKKNHPGFFHRIFCEQPKLFQICILRGPTPNSVDQHEATLCPATSASGVIFSSEIRSREVVEHFSVERGSWKILVFLRWKNGNFGENRGVCVCAQKRNN